MAQRKQALFENLVYDEAENLLETTFIGDEAHYILLDNDFKRHISAESVDRQVVGWMQQQASSNKDLVSENIMSMLGKDDLFTKAAIDASISNMDQVMEQGIPSDARTMLGMMGFKIIVDVHGELVDLKLPGGGGMFGDDWLD